MERVKMQYQKQDKTHKHISIRFELPDYEKFKAWAEAEGRPMAAQARTLILKGLEEYSERSQEQA